MSSIRLYSVSIVHSSVLDKASKEAHILLSDRAWSEETFKNKILRPPDGINKIVLIILLCHLQMRAG